MTDDVRRVRAGRRTVEVHRPGKVLFPGSGETKEYTKGDLADYYRAVAPFMLPHLRGRPLMLERHPDGVDGPRFMQKNTPESYPDWITRVEVPKEGGTVCHTVCDDSATLLHLADQACLTLHRWLSRVGRLERPDRMVFDLDPSDEGDDFATVRSAAELLGELLDELRLPSALMTTGSRGLHVVVPVNGHDDFDEVRAFARTSPTFSSPGTPTGSPPPPARRTAATASISTSSATPTPRPRSPPTRSAPGPAPPWPPRCPGASWTTRASTPAAGPSRTPWTRPAPIPGPV